MQNALKRGSPHSTRSDGRSEHERGKDIRYIPFRFPNDRGDFCVCFGRFFHFLDRPSFLSSVTGAVFQSRIAGGSVPIAATVGHPLIVGA